MLRPEHPQAPRSLLDALARLHPGVVPHLLDVVDGDALEVGMLHPQSANLALYRLDGDTRRIVDVERPLAEQRRGVAQPEQLPLG